MESVYIFLIVFVSVFRNSNPNHTITLQKERGRGGCSQGGRGGAQPPALPVEPKAERGQGTLSVFIIPG